MKQILSAELGDQWNSASPAYRPLPAESLWATSNFIGLTSHPWAVSGTFRNLVVRLGSALGAGDGATATLMVNGVASALTVTLSEGDSTARDTTHEVAITAGDYVNFRFDPIDSDGATGIRYALKFDSNTDYLSAYGNAGSFDEGGANYLGFWGQQIGWNTDSTFAETLIAVDGAFTCMYVRGNDNPSPGTFEFAVYKNGVKQDGSGGTVDTRATVQPADTTAYRLFYLPVKAGDIVYVGGTAAGGVPGYIFYYGFSLAFESGSPDVCLWGVNKTQICSETITGYSPVTSKCYDNWWQGAPEEDDDGNIGGVTTFRLVHLYVALSTAPGAGGSGDSYTFSLRKNETSPDGTPSVTIAETATTGSDLTGSMTVSDGDIQVCMRVVPANTPANAPMVIWGLAVKTSDPELQCSVPVSDVSVGNWVNEASGTTNLYQSIDDGTIADDDDYIETGEDPVDESYKCTLSDTIIAPDDGDVVIIIRGQFVD